MTDDPDPDDVFDQDPAVDEHDDSPMFGTSWTVPGESEEGNPVEWSTSDDGYYDEVTGEEVEPT